MILSGLLSFLYTYISNMLLPVNIPSADEDFFNGFLDIIEFLENGKPFFSLVFPIDMTIFFNMFIAIWGFQHIYNFAMWIIKKVPLLGIK